MNSVYHTELSSHEGTRCQFNGSRCAIKLGIDVHQDFYVVVMQEGAGNPKPPQRFYKEAFLQWATRLKQRHGQVHAVYEACGFGFGLQRRLAALGIECHVVCPQKLDEHNKRVKTDGLDAKALCLKLDRFVEGKSRCPGNCARAQRRRGTRSGTSSPARATGPGAQTTRSAGAQFNGQSRMRTGATMVEEARLCPVGRAGMD